MIARLTMMGVAGLVSFGPVDPNEPPPEPPEPLVPVMTAHEIAVDNDIFAIYVQSEDLCEQAREMVADGISINDMVDGGVEVLTSKDHGFVGTAEGALYLRGLLVGCITE